MGAITPASERTLVAVTAAEAAAIAPPHKTSFRMISSLWSWQEGNAHNYSKFQAPRAAGRGMAKPLPLTLPSYDDRRDRRGICRARDPHASPARKRDVDHARWRRHHGAKRRRLPRGPRQSWPQAVIVRPGFTGR
jgi:hypothetical protein